MPVTANRAIAMQINIVDNISKAIEQLKQVEAQEHIDVEVTYQGKAKQFTLEEFLKAVGFM